MGEQWRCLQVMYADVQTSLSFDRIEVTQSSFLLYVNRAAYEHLYCHPPVSSAARVCVYSILCRRMSTTDETVPPLRWSPAPVLLFFYCILSPFLSDTCQDAAQSREFPTPFFRPEKQPFCTGQTMKRNVPLLLLSWSGEECSEAANFITASLMR